MSRKQHLLSLILVALLTNLYWIPAQTQDEQNKILFYICIDPVGIEGDEGTPYLITFRATLPIGLVVSEAQAQVALYSTENLSLSTYDVVPDAGSGIYRPTGYRGADDTTSNINNSQPCVNEYPETITTTLLGTETREVTPDRVAIVGARGDTNFNEQDFLGGYGFYFISNNALYQKEFQIIQMAEGAEDTEMSFPFLAPDETIRFAMIANKSIKVRRSFADNETLFSADCPSDVLLIFKKVLEGEGNDINLPHIIEAGNFRIFSRFGLVATYSAGGFLRINMPTVPEPRGELTDGASIRSIVDGVEFAYADADNPTVGIGFLSEAEIFGIDEQGQLHIRVPGSNSDIIVMEPWLVEVVEAE